MNKFLTLTGLLFISGCTQAEDPKVIAQQYWQAMQSGDYKKARSLITADSQSAFDEYALLPESNKPSLQAVALVDSQTTVTTLINTSDSSLQFNTVLVMQDGKWRIDAKASEIPPPDSALEQRLNDMAEHLSGIVDSNVEQMEQALGQSMQMLDELLQSGAEELSESVNDSVNQLNDSIQEAMRKLEQRRQQQHPAPGPGNDEGAI